MEKAVSMKGAFSGWNGAERFALFARCCDLCFGKQGSRIVNLFIPTSRVVADIGLQDSLWSLVLFEVIGCASKHHREPV